VQFAWILPRLPMPILPVFGNAFSMSELVCSRVDFLDRERLRYFEAEKIRTCHRVKTQAAEGSLTLCMAADGKRILFRLGRNSIGFLEPNTAERDGSGARLSKVLDEKNVAFATVPLRIDQRMTVG
jgi:hypothetical protein